MKKLELNQIADINGGSRDKWGEFKDGFCFGLSISTGIAGFFTGGITSKLIGATGIGATIGCELF
ncbi:MAG: hypothetical protein EOO91_05800 [Pedobacter sp.]|nr:MAG: hypothetical protein EOO91_05800 [Pedobacter sp.]